MDQNTPIINGGHYWIKTQTSDPFIAQALKLLVKQQPQQDVVVWVSSGSNATHPNVEFNSKVKVLRMVDPFIRIPEEKQVKNLDQAIQEVFEESSLVDGSFVHVLKRYRALSGAALRDGLIQLLEHLIISAEQGSSQAIKLLQDRYHYSDDAILAAKKSLAADSSH